MIWPDQNMLTVVIDQCAGATDDTVAVIIPGRGTSSAPGQIIVRLDTVTMWRQYDETKSDPVPHIDLFVPGAPPLRLNGPGVPELGRLLSQRFVN